MSLLQQFIQYLLSLQKPPSKITVKNYKADVGQFIRWYQQSFQKLFNPQEVSPHIIEIYKKEKSVSPKSLKRHVSSLRSFFRFLKQAGLIQKDPFSQPLPSIPKKEDLWHIKDFKNHLYVYNASTLTIKNYVNDVLQFLHWVKRVSGAIHAWDIKEQDVLKKLDAALFAQYRDRLLHDAKLSPKSINRKLSSLRRYLNFIEKEGIIKPVQILEQNVKFKPNLFVTASQQSERSNLSSYSRFPPLRLFQKTLKLSNYILEYLFIIPLASFLTHTQSLFKPKKLNFIKPYAIQKPTTQIHNIPKSFYAPISTSYLPFHKKIYIFLRHKRPLWYKKYHQNPIATYIHVSILLIIVILSSAYIVNLFGIYSPQKAILSTRITPQTFHFTGRLFDRLNNPIAKEIDVTFSLYSDSISTIPLWQEVHTITPNSDGTFSVTLGTTNPITEFIFSQTKLFLGIQIAQDSELKPRIQLPTTEFSQIAQSVQGLVPIDANQTKNVLLALDSSGNLTIGNQSTTFQATDGTFTLSGKTLVLNTIPGSNTNIQLAPDGFGKIDIQKPIINSSTQGVLNPGAVEIDDKTIINATESAQAALVINNNSTGDLLTASSSSVAKFVVDNDGWVGIGTASPENALDVKGNITPVDTGLYNIGSPLRSWKNIYTQNVLPTLISGTQGWWQRNSQAISPLNTTDDLVFGGLSTDSAKLRIEGITGSIITKGNLTFDDVSGLIQTTNNRTLTLGGTNTSNIIVNPKNSNIGGYFGPQTDNVTDLGASSSARFRNVFIGPGSFHIQCLTSDGCGQGLDYAISIATTSGNLQIGLNGTTSSPSSFLTLTQSGNVNISGIISTGTWQASSIKANYGGTGQTTYSKGDIIYAESNNPTTLSKRSIGTTNQVLTVSGGIPTWQTPPFIRNLGTIIPTNITDDFIIGGSATSSAKFQVFGTTGNASMSGQMTIAGNLGVGTTNPLYKLHVSDSQSATAAAFIENTDTGPNSAALALKLGFTAGANTNYFTTFLNGNGERLGQIRYNAPSNKISYDTTANDFAEYFKKDDGNESLQPAELICLGNSGGVTKCTQNNQNILGIISDQAGFVGGSGHENDPNYVLVGLLGQLPLKVSTESGTIQPGDYLTNSSTPGVAQKATRAGRVVGRALNECRPELVSGSCLVALHPSWYDPDVFLTDTGNLSIDLDPNFGTITQTPTPSTPLFTINQKATGQLISRLGIFSQAMIANLEAGFIKTKQLSTQTLTASTATIDTLKTNILNTDYLILDTKIVSPIAYVDQISTDTISPLSSDSVLVNGRIVIAPSRVIASPDLIGAKQSNDNLFEIQNASGSSVASIDTLGNATFSGTLASSSLIADQASVSGILSVDKIIANDIKIPNLPYPSNFPYGLLAFGPSTFTDASLTGTLAIGSPNSGLILADNSLNVLNGSLEIQPLRQGGINFFGGLISFDIEGNMLVKGNTSFAKNLVLNNASGSAVFTVNEQGNVIASGSGTFSKLNLNPVSKAFALSNLEIIATGSAGIATISAYQSELTIQNNLVTEKSLIYITPSANTNNEVLYLLRQVPNQSFTVGVNNQLISDIPFNWLIVN